VFPKNIARQNPHILNYDFDASPGKQNRSGSAIQPWPRIIRTGMKMRTSTNKRTVNRQDGIRMAHDLLW
jgi:hypothetical protein